MSNYKLVHNLTMNVSGIVSTVDTATDLVMWADNPRMLNDILQRYVPASVLPFVGELEERWASEIRKITVVFAHMSCDFDAEDESSESLARLQKVNKRFRITPSCYELRLFR